MRETILLGLCFILYYPASTSASILGDLAASMPPGTWAKLTANNDVKALASESGASGILTHYSFSGIWDPVAKRMHFMGADHHGGAAGYGQKWVYYDDATNSWVVKGGGTGNVEGLPQVMPLIPQHGYDHLAIDPAGGNLYLYRYGSKTVYRYPIASSGPWTPISMPATGYINITTGMEYFPGLGLTVYITGEPGGEMMVMSPSGTWSDLKGFGGAGGYQGFSEYSPKYNAVVFGGPSAVDPKQIWRLDSNKTITKLTSAPVSLGGQRGNLAVDPVTGNFLVLGYGQFWELDPRGTGVWRKLTNLPPADLHADPDASGNVSYGVISGPVSNYGVILYTSCRIGECHEYVYKHSQGVGTEEEGKKENGKGQIKVSPNPVTGGRALVSIADGPAQSAAIYDARGRQVARFGKGNEFLWDASHRSNGVYLLKMGQGARISVKRILVQK